MIRISFIHQGETYYGRLLGPAREGVGGTEVAVQVYGDRKITWIRDKEITVVE